MFRKGANYSTERVKCSTEVPNTRRTLSNVSWRCKYSTDNVKCSTEVLNIPRGGQDGV